MKPAVKQDSTVVVTGGASGIGAAVASKAIAAGASVAILDLNEARGHDLASELGKKCVFISCDVTVESSLQAALDLVTRTLAPVQGLVCCAGAAPVPLTIEDTSLAEWSRILQTHLTGTFATCKIIGAHIAASGNGGAVVATASVLGFNSGPVLAYGAAKSATINLTKALAVQWASKNVRVNAVAPGWTETPFLRPKERAGGRDLTPILSASPQHRLLQPEEIAEVVWFLLSPASTAVTGSVIVCDGGTLAGAGWAPYGGFPAA
jgi:NAD(P)-dependent dehydrogenase (short-subunit alcohol dehydrogenase family)